MSDFVKLIYIIIYIISVGSIVGSGTESAGGSLSEREGMTPSQRCHFIKQIKAKGPRTFLGTDVTSAKGPLSYCCASCKCVLGL